MAFSQDIVLDNGIPINQAYGKIVLMESTPDLARYRVEYFINEENSKGEMSILMTRYYFFTPDLGSVENLFKQAYNNAKSRQEFEGVIDI